jgi:hypothetical protein
MTELEHLNNFLRTLADSDAGIRAKIVNLRRYTDAVINRNEQKQQKQ